MINFKDEANKIKDQLITIRRDIHMHPEVGFEEVRTSNLIKDFLKNEGIEYREVAKTGVCAIIKGTKEGKVKTVALRADMDALPIQDKKVCEYSSKVPGKMHACGHDAHATILLGVSAVSADDGEATGGEVVPHTDGWGCRFAGACSVADAALEDEAAVHFGLGYLGC